MWVWCCYYVYIYQMMENVCVQYRFVDVCRKELKIVLLYDWKSLVKLS